MSRINNLLLIMVCVFASHWTSAQLSVSGEYRPRAEYRHGFQTLAAEDQEEAFFVDQRTRLNLDYQTDKYAVRIIFQDIRTWGSQVQLVNNDGALTTLHEAWGQVFLSDRFSLKLGRQEIIYNDHRIFGSVAWAQQARSHDAALLMFNSEDTRLDLGLAFNQDAPRSVSTFYTVDRSYKTFQYLWFQKKTDKLTSSLLFLNNGLQGGDQTDADTYFSQTMGGRFSLNLDPVIINSNLFYQGGKLQSGGKTSASLVSLDLNYNLNGGSVATVGAELISGNDQVNPASKNKAFNPFYGTNHKFNGLMDYFFVGNHINNVGLRDFYLQFKTGKKWRLTSQLHFFLTEEDLIDPTSSQSSAAADSYLGTEIDLVVTHDISEGVNLQLGYSQMFATESMEYLKGGDKDATSNWAWAMLTLKPVFYSNKE